VSSFRKPFVENKVVKIQIEHHQSDRWRTRPYLFPGGHGRGSIHKASADRILREACLKLEIERVSTHTHSFRTHCINSYQRCWRIFMAYSGNLRSSYPSSLGTISRGHGETKRKCDRYFRFLAVAKFFILSFLILEKSLQILVYKTLTNVC
jgi:hypothetical protein